MIDIGQPFHTTTRQPASASKARGWRDRARVALHGGDDQPAEQGTLSATGGQMRDRGVSCACPLSAPARRANREPGVVISSTTVRSRQAGAGMRAACRVAAVLV